MTSNTQPLGLKSFTVVEDEAIPNVDGKEMKSLPSTTKKSGWMDSIIPFSSMATPNSSVLSSSSDTSQTTPTPTPTPSTVAPTSSSFSSVLVSSIKSACSASPVTLSATSSSMPSSYFLSPFWVSSSSSSSSSVISKTKLMERFPYLSQLFMIVACTFILFRITELELFRYVIFSRLPFSLLNNPLFDFFTCLFFFLCIYCWKLKNAIVNYFSSPAEED